MTVVQGIEPEVREVETRAPQPVANGRIRTVIEPPRAWTALNLAEVWRYRDLLSLLVLRDVTAKYRQSIIGVGWVVLKPVASMLIFTLIFGRVARLPSDGVPYAFG